MDQLKLAFLAMDNAKEGITISDARIPDYPLIFVSKGFSRITGYTFDEAVGGNCRYLQGIDTDPGSIKAIRAALNDNIPIQIELINYRKNGEPFWNYLSITPIFNEQKELTHYIGIQDDITELKKKRLSKQNIEKEKLIAKTMLIAERRERHRVGMELHDNISQMLAAVKLYLRIPRKKLDNEIDPFKTAVDILDNTIIEVRALSRKLVSPGLDENGLIANLLKLITTTQAVVDFTLKFTPEKYVPELLSDTEELIIFRVVQEQLNNIIKYSKATDVSINLFILNKKCSLHITDNGIGFNTKSVHSGIGLSNMRTRVEAVNGKLELTSILGEGTALIVEIDVAE